MIDPKITLDQASSLALAKYDRPVITAYRLGLVVFRPARAGSIDGHALRVRAVSRRQYRQAVTFLTSYGVLAPVRGGLATESLMFTALCAPSVSAAEIACTVDRSRTCRT